jgi:hypothetical protein
MRVYSADRRPQCCQRVSPRTYSIDRKTRFSQSHCKPGGGQPAKGASEQDRGFHASRVSSGAVLRTPPVLMFGTKLRRRTGPSGVRSQDRRPYAQHVFTSDYVRSNPMQPEFQFFTTSPGKPIVRRPRQATDNTALITLARATLVFVCQCFSQMRGKPLPLISENWNHRWGETLQ